MTDSQIAQLEKALKQGRVIWNPEPNTVRHVLKIFKVRDEPSPCALFDGGTYVSLYNCELCDFMIVTPIL